MWQLPPLGAAMLWQLPALSVAVLWQECADAAGRVPLLDGA